MEVTKFQKRNGLRDLNSDGSMKSISIVAQVIQSVVGMMRPDDDWKDKRRCREILTLMR